MHALWVWTQIIMQIGTETYSKFTIWQWIDHWRWDRVWGKTSGA